MRILVQPPPTLRCELCSGELRFKLIQSADRAFDMEIEVFVCANCGREQLYVASPDHYGPHIRAA